MARAKVKLTGCLTHTRGGRKMKKGDTVIVTSPSEIAMYEALSEYTVTRIKDAPKPKQKASKQPAPPADPPKGSGDGDGDDDEDGDEVPTYTTAQLEARNKSELQELAFRDFDLDLDPDDLKKAVMIKEIMKAQIARAKAADEE